MTKARWIALAPTLTLLVAVAAGCSGKGTTVEEPTANGGQGDDGSGSATSGGDGTNLGGDTVLGGGTAPSEDQDLSDLLGQGCASAEAETSRAPVYMDIVLDASGSMDGRNNNGFLAGSREKDPLAPTRGDNVCDDTDEGVDACPGNQGLTGKKWIAVRGALNAYFDALAAKASDGTLGVSLVRFSGKGPTGARTPLKVVDKGHATALKARYNPAVWPNAGTPLDTFVASELAFLKGFTPAAPLLGGGKRVLVLMTDGVPSQTSTESVADKQKKIIDAVTAAAKATGAERITTFAVGIGNPTDAVDTYDAAFMSKVGQAGGSSTAGCDASWAGGATTPCHLQITPGTKSAAALQLEFSAAIDKIAGSVASCEFAIQRTEGVAIDPNLINVVKIPKSGAKSLVPRSTTDGWSYDDETSPTAVILNGAACTSFKSAENEGAQIKIVIGCPSQVN